MTNIRDLPPVLTVIEAAEFLRISRGSAYALAKRGELPGVFRLGRTLRVNRDAMLDSLRQGCGAQEG